MFEFDIYNIKCQSNEIEVARKVTISRIKQRQNKKAKKKWRFDGNKNFMLTISHLVNTYDNF